MIELSYCQNDPLMGELFWKKDSLITHILFELCLFRNWPSVLCFYSPSTKVLFTNRYTWQNFFLRFLHLVNRLYVIFYKTQKQTKVLPCLTVGEYIVIHLGIPAKCMAKMAKSDPAFADRKYYGKKNHQFMPTFKSTKGQLISEWNFGVFKSPKKPTKFLTDFCPSFMGQKSV